MDLSPWTVLAALVSSAVATVVLWVLKRKYDHSFFRRHGIPGPEPELLLGNYKQLDKDRIKVMDGWVKKYGKVFGYYMAEIPYVIITDVEMIKECFVKQMNAFHERPDMLIPVEPLLSSLLYNTGEKWKKVRSVVNPSFSSTKMKLMTRTIVGCCETTLQVINDHVADGKAVNITKLFKGLSLDVISKCALAWEVGCQGDPNDPLLKVVRSVAEDTEVTLVEGALKIPAFRSALRWVFPFTPISKIYCELLERLRRIIHLRRRGDKARTLDMLQLLLDAQDGSGRDGCEGRKLQCPLISDDQLLGNCFVFLVAGYETTATAMAIAMYELAVHPEEQDAIYEEMKEALEASGGELTYEAMQQLKRLDMFVCECLRMYPPIALITSRKCNKETVVLGQHFPAGVNVMAATWQVHHDPEVWSDPFRFDPERFRDGVRAHHPGAFIPFGLGPRECLGKRFSVLEIKAAICTTLRKCKVLVCEETAVPLKPVVRSLFLRSESDIMLKLGLRGP
uniref:Putative cytochrome p450 cyp3/cyp5/cyp6/cyp9 subfamily n=1 Tax=Amblyomma triste TaxID=251400 RepID=A0A023GNE0_AMBTT